MHPDPTRQTAPPARPTKRACGEHPERGVVRLVDHRYSAMSDEEYGAAVEALASLLVALDRAGRHPPADAGG